MGQGLNPARRIKGGDPVCRATLKTPTGPARRAPMSGNGIAPLRRSQRGDRRRRVVVVGNVREVPGVLAGKVETVLHGPKALQSHDRSGRP